jgi:hypothetical protein
MGLRLNEFDLNRTAMITNLHIVLNLAAWFLNYMLL